MDNRFIHVYTPFGEPSVFPITPASVKRQWMDDTMGHAYYCLPLKVANQYGWVVHAPFRFRATWSGGNDNSTVIVEKFNTPEDPVVVIEGHFHYGTLTISTDFLIKTPPGVSTYMRGTTNSHKHGFHPLDAIVETDWLPFHAPMSYRFTEPGSVEFERGEPLFMFFPIERDYIESFELSFKSMEHNQELQEQNRKYIESRTAFIEEKGKGAQKHYIKGSVVDEKVDIENHRIKLNLASPE